MSKTGFVYILTSNNKKVLYIGVTSNLQKRLLQHMHEPKGFVRRYAAQNLGYCEAIHGMMNAIRREKELKGWKRLKKEALIEVMNPEWEFLNEKVLAGVL